MLPPYALEINYLFDYSVDAEKFFVSDRCFLWWLSVQVSSDEEAVRRTEGEIILRYRKFFCCFTFSPSVFCFAKSTSLVRGRQWKTD